MILTEKEAREKICQQTLTGDPELNGNCEGPRCMAWRWDENVPYRVEPRSLEEMKGSGCEDCALPFSEEWHLYGDRYRCPRCRSAAVRMIEEPERRRGYCGLAGRVEVR